MRGLVLTLVLGTVVSAQGPPCEPVVVCPCPDPFVSRYPDEREPPNVVLRWNALALAAVRADRTPPPVAARHLAVLHLAMYDAVSPGRRTHQPFLIQSAGPIDASSEAAVAAAAHRVLKTIYPRRTPTFDAELDALPDLAGLEPGIRWGHRVADRVLAWRGGDLAADDSTYAPKADPGRWTPTPPGFRSALLPAWGRTPPFARPAAGTVRPAEPPALTSPEYAAALREVRAVGSIASRDRTADETEVANFWADGDGTVTPPGHWNRIAAGVARDRGLNRADTARLFAMLNVALADAAIACWDCKYRFDVWRPVTAIRRADPGWTPLLDTPPFPSYTSGHSSFSGAAAAVLAEFFGTDRVRFATTSDALPGVTRSFAGFRDAANEAGMSRVYGGIHWAFDNTAGLASGRQVGEYVSRGFFRSVPEAGDRSVSADFAIRRR